MRARASRPGAKPARAACASISATDSRLATCQPVSKASSAGSSRSVARTSSMTTSAPPGRRACAACAKKAAPDRRARTLDRERQVEAVEPIRQFGEVRDREAHLPPHRPGAGGEPVREANLRRAVRDADDLDRPPPREVQRGGADPAAEVEHAPVAAPWSSTRAWAWWSPLGGSRRRGPTARGGSPAPWWRAGTSRCSRRSRRRRASATDRSSPTRTSRRRRARAGRRAPGSSATASEAGPSFQVHGEGCPRGRTNGCRKPRVVARDHRQGAVGST